MSSTATWQYSQPAPVRSLVAGPAAGDAVAGLVEAAELLDVDVDQLAGVAAAVAVRGLGRLQPRQPVQTRGACSTAHTVEVGHAQLGGDPRRGPPQPAELLDQRLDPRWGPARTPRGPRTGPSSLRRRRSGPTTDNTVRVDTPNASAASSTVQPSMPDPFTHQGSLARQEPSVTVNLHGVSLW